MIHVGLQTIPVRTPTSVLASRMVTRSVATAAADYQARNEDGSRTPPRRSIKSASVSDGGATPAAKLGRLLGILIDLLHDDEVVFTLHLVKELAASPMADANLALAIPEFDSLLNGLVDKCGGHLRNSTLDKLGGHQRERRQSAPPASVPERAKRSRQDVAPPPKPIEPSAATRSFVALFPRFPGLRSLTSSPVERASNTSQDSEAVTECRQCLALARTSVHSRETTLESGTELCLHYQESTLDSDTVARRHSRDSTLDSDTVVRRHSRDSMLDSDTVARRHSRDSMLDSDTVARRHSRQSILDSGMVANHSRESIAESDTVARRSTETDQLFRRLPQAPVRGREAGSTTMLRRSMDYFRRRISRTAKCQDFDCVCVSHSNACGSYDQTRFANAVPESDADNDGEHECRYTC